MSITFASKSGVVVVEGIPCHLTLQVRVVGRASFIQPGVRLSVVGVILPDAAAILGNGSHQADFVAVVDGWRAWHGHLHQSRALQLLNRGGPVIVWIQVTNGWKRVGILIQHENRAVGVVAAKEVQHGSQRFGSVAFLQVEDAFVELAHAKGCQRTCRRACVMVIIREGGVAPQGKHSGAELVVHHRVPLASEQPAVCDAPFFAGDVTFRVNRVNRIAEAFPVIISGVIQRPGVHIATDIQTPAIRGEHPVPGNGDLRVILVVPDPGSYIRVVGIKLGQGVVTPPGFVIGSARRSVRTHAGTRPSRHVGEVEPVSIYGVLAFAGADFIVPPVAVEVFRVGRDVVEHTIHDQMHAARLQPCNQGIIIRLVTKHLVDAQVIRGVVAVIRGRGEDRIEVDRVDAQSNQVIQLFGQTSQVTTIEVLGVGAFAGVVCVSPWIADEGVPVFCHGTINCSALFAIEKRSSGLVVGGVAISKTIGEYLVDDGVLDPAGCLEIRIINSKLI